mgnify:CR=1 FL=1
MDLANLNAFIAIAEIGSFSGAGERLHEPEQADAGGEMPASSAHATGARRLRRCVAGWSGASWRGS